MVHVPEATLKDSLIDTCHEIYMATQCWWSAACPDTPLKSELSFFLTTGKSSSLSPPHIISHLCTAAITTLSPCAGLT